MEKGFSSPMGNSSPAKSWRPETDFVLDVSGLDEMDLPAYSPTADRDASLGDSDFCCAYGFDWYAKLRS